jgi:hypothetical protein
MLESQAVSALDSILRYRGYPAIGNRRRGAMSKAGECCGWTAWFEMAEIDEDGRRVATPSGTVAAPDSMVIVI